MTDPESITNGPGPAVPAAVPDAVVETVAAPAASVSRPEASDELHQIIAKAVRYIKAKRGGDLAAILLVGSAVRESLLPHSDINFVVLVRGPENRHEVVRIQDRIVEIRYIGLASVEEQMKYSVRWPTTLRKARVVFEFEAEGSQFLEQMHGRFRQGAPSITLHDKIRIRAEALHWLGKATDHVAQPAAAAYLFSIYLDECMNAFYYLRGFWLGPHADNLRFITQRDPALGNLLHQALTASELTKQVELGQAIAQHLFKDIPAPARID